MDIQKELESFKTVAIAKGWSIDGETTQTNYRFYSLTTNSGWEAWQAAKAQAVPYKSCSIKSHEIIINETKNELIDGYDIAKEDEYLLESLVYRGVCMGKAQAVPEGFVLVKKDHLSEAVEKIELMFEEDSTLALGELLPIQQGIKAMIEAQEQKG